MNLKQSKLLRRAVNYRPTRDRTEYDQQTFKQKLWERPTAHGLKNLEVCSITKPMHVKAGSPRHAYRTMKRLERTIGLDAIYAQMLADHEQEVSV